MLIRNITLSTPESPEEIFNFGSELKYLKQLLVGIEIINSNTRKSVVKWKDTDVVEVVAN